MSLPALYTPEEAAAKLRVTRRSIYQWLSGGRLRGMKAGQHWRIPEEELIIFMQAGQRAPAAKAVKDTGPALIHKPADPVCSPGQTRREPVLRGPG